MHTNIVRQFKKIQLVLYTLMHLIYASGYTLFTVNGRGVLHLSLEW